MNRTRVSVLVAGLIAAGILSACGGGVDRAKSIDNYVKGLEGEGITVDRDCIKGVFDKYSDDEIKELGDQGMTTEVRDTCGGGSEEAPAEEAPAEEAPAEEAPEEGS
jgi:hypothetical protein